jgi:hypothetical protein
LLNFKGFNAERNPLSPPGQNVPPKIPFVACDGAMGLRVHSVSLVTKFVLIIVLSQTAKREWALEFGLVY